MGGAAAFFGIHTPDMRVTPFGGNIIPSSSKRILQASVDTHYRLKEQENEFVNRYSNRWPRFVVVDPYYDLRVSMSGNWALGEATGQPRIDSSQNARTLTNNNNVAQVAGTIGSWTGNVSDFTGASSQSLSRSGNDAFLWTSGSFSVAGWFKATSFAANQGLIGASQGGNGYFLQAQSTRYIWSVNDSAGGTHQVAVNNAPSTSAWNFFYFFVDTTNQLYGGSQNNVALTTAAYTLTPGSTATTFALGQNLGGSFLTGQMAFVRKWNRLLTTAEITQQFGAGTPVVF